MRKHITAVSLGIAQSSDVSAWDIGDIEIYVKSIAEKLQVSKILAKLTSVSDDRWVIKVDWELSPFNAIEFGHYSFLYNALRVVLPNHLCGDIEFW